MKKLLLFVLAVSFGLYGSAQERAVLPKAIRNIAVKQKAKPIKDTENPDATYVPGQKGADLMVDTQIGGTQYDLQTNSSCQNRVYLYDDGTIGAAWTMGFTPANFPERGTGYNYYDGNSWGPDPTVRIDNIRTGWPSYSKWGDNGEIVVNHTDFDGLWIGHRDQKGTGAWTSSILAGPAGAVDISWPRVVTSGINNEFIHTIYVTYQAYQGQTDALLYSRSSDGGTTWDVDNYYFDELGPNFYTNIGGDVYDFAEPKNGILAFLVGDSWTDLVLMKSMDNGDSWEKNIVWNCPYPLHVTGQATDTFYDCDGSHHLAIDNNGLIHVVFGINRAVADDAGEYYFPGVDGIAYWNENMPAFSSNLNALDPYGDPGTELVEDYNLIGWSQDINGNGTLDILADWGTYYLGLSSMVQLTIDDQNQLFLVFSSVTEGYDNGTQNYRHIWTRASIDDGATWGPFNDMNGDLLYIFDECVFPSISPTSDENIYFEYQADTEPGLAVRGDLDPYGDNFIRVMKVLKADIVGINEENAIRSYDVSQNMPNPFSGSSLVKVNLKQAANLSIEVTNTMGQVVYTKDAGYASAGMNTLTIDGSKLVPGVYFYTIKANEASVTKKMIVK